MLNSPLEYSTSLQIGSVFFVSPNEIKVQLDTEAPDSVALNTSFPKPFPRINSYLLIPSEQGYIVGQVDWITVENSPFPKRKGMQDFGLIDLPFPLRKLSLSPLGSLRIKSSQENKKDDNNSDFLQENNYIFSRGVNIFPTVGDIVLLPTNEQLKAIVTSGENLQVKIGTSPLAGNADVMIDPDRLFGRHLAVLGNTGSGKSCSVAGLVRWCLDDARRKLREGKKNCNSRFIILDPNGEYSKAFEKDKDLDNQTITKFSIDADVNDKQLQVPLWMWNSTEWDALVQASEKTQKPLLKRALMEVRTNDTSEGPDVALKSNLAVIATNLNTMFQSGDSYEAWKVGDKLEAFKTDIATYSTSNPTHQQDLSEINTLLDKLTKSPYKQLNGRYSGSYPKTLLTPIFEKINDLMSKLAGADIKNPIDENVPKKFDLDAFLKHLNQLIDIDRNPQYYDTLLLRLNALVSNQRMQCVINDKTSIDLDNWLEKLLGNTSKEMISIVDLSLIPSEMAHLITAVVTRLIFESLQRYRNHYQKALPTVLIMEEAHTFIKRYNPDDENVNASMLCCKFFEKIAREGRKFGLGLVLSSQRPSELSPTVLSQCNTFLLHRISNDRDQEMIHKLLPDNLQGILRDLPVLPARNAILLGWAAELPVLVQMNKLPKEQQPQSQDPDFWDVWTRKEEREVNWKIIADDWQGKANLTSEQPSGCQESTNSTEDFLF